MANAKDSRIQMYAHCRTCMKSMDKEHGYDSDERLAVGWTQQGIQVVCETCGKSVADIDFLGQKVDYYRPTDVITKKAEHIKDEGPCECEMCKKEVKKDE